MLVALGETLGQRVSKAEGWRNLPRLPARGRSLEDVLREAPFATPRFHWLKDRGWLTNQLALEQKILESAERVFHAQREKVQELVSRLAAQK